MGISQRSEMRSIVVFTINFLLLLIWVPHGISGLSLTDDVFMEQSDNQDSESPYHHELSPLLQLTTTTSSDISALAISSVDMTSSNSTAIEEIDFEPEPFDAEAYQAVFRALADTGAKSAYILRYYPSER